MTGIKLIQSAIEDCESVEAALGNGWWQRTMEKLKQALVKYEKVETENKQLKENLLKYGGHENGCNPSPAENDCKCGFLKALKEAYDV